MRIPSAVATVTSTDPSDAATAETSRTFPPAAVSTAAWNDEAHVEANRELYAENFEIATNKIGNRFGFQIPAGGFFLWLDVGDGEAATQKLWRAAGVKVLPGGYLARAVGGDNPGRPYIRIALVHERARTRQALLRLRQTLG